MNKLITHLATLLMGATVGSLVTTLVIKQKYARIAEDEIESIKAYYDRTRPQELTLKGVPIDQKAIDLAIEFQDAVEEVAKKIVEGDGPRTNPSGVMSRPSLANNPYEQAKKNYNLIRPMAKQPEIEPSEPPESDSDDDDEEDDGVVRDESGMSEEDHLRAAKVDRTEPYIIEHEEFFETYPHHEKVTLYYYRLDDVLTEENEEIIDDIEGIVGYDAIAKLDTQTSVWVRNEPLAIDYEIISLTASFAETILGVRKNGTMSPREKYEAKQKRRKTDENKGE